MMNLNLDALQVAWRLVPALILVLTMMLRLAHQSRQSGRLAEEPVSYTSFED